jgi:hypothetical protein
MRWPTYVVSTSWGNDSVALIQWMHEQRKPGVVAIYMDTGWAADGWAERVARGEEWATSLGVEVAQTTSIGMEALVKRKKTFPRSGMQFCTEILKIEPFVNFMDARDPEKLAICVVGVRREESARRRGYPEWVGESPAHGGRSVWAPLANYTEEMRNALLARAGFEPLPHRSRECSPCINSGKADIRLLEEPTIAKIERIEAELGLSAKGQVRAMFRAKKRMGAVGIREVVRWANTTHGTFSLEDDEGGENCDGGFCGV